MPFRFPLIVVGAALALAMGTAQAVAPATGKPLTAQQQRMVDCNKQAIGKTGADRKTFISTCLKGQVAAPAAAQTQQEKMKSCNADASSKSLKGANRKAFISSCLKSAPAVT